MVTDTVLTKSQMVVMVAKDVIKQLNRKNNPLEAGTHGYVYSKYEFDSLKGDLKEHVDAIQAKNCKVCALGAALLSKARLFDEVPIKKVANEKETYHPVCRKAIYLEVNNKAAYSSLSKIFDKRQMQLIESAYETSYYGPNVNTTAKIKDEFIDSILFGYKYENDKERLCAIMRNVIKNEGVFIPKPATAKAREEWSQEAALL